MSTEVAFSDYYVGPAVIVDDEFDTDPGIRAVAAQLAEAGLPVYSHKELPPITVTRHWRGFSVIVLDWELHGAEPGVAIPPDLLKQQEAQTAAFVHKLLQVAYCPVFIFSSQDVDHIWQALTESADLPPEQLRNRILVSSKDELGSGLVDRIVRWTNERPAVHALKVWEGACDAAKADFFSELEVASSEWPKVLWKTSLKDSVSPSFELSEMITRSIVHRFGPLEFDEKMLDGTVDAVDPAIIRRVIHRSCVIPASALHDDVLMPGDFFATEDVTNGALPEQVFINLTPACELVPRKEDIDHLRLIVLTGNRVPSKEIKSKAKAREVAQESRRTDVETVSVLFDSAYPYRFSLKDWTFQEWGNVKAFRIGRLLEPHLTVLQQKFALHSQRQGVPRLPDEFLFVADDA